MKNTIWVTDDKNLKCIIGIDSVIDLTYIPPVYIDDKGYYAADISIFGVHNPTFAIPMNDEEIVKNEAMKYFIKFANSLINSLKKANKVNKGIMTYLELHIK